MSIMIAVAWADIILCAVGQALLFVIPWAVIAVVLYMLFRRVRFRG